ncbi:hypothetical protein EVG20_g7356 [Dentipellis fragilis]|uniref:Uncharacterized protein n=1 Tax=Dentipellis fragilis TaxID=205917 RepID=A0A4Y9YG05_9AGAM|nr:hypothetical protein EVG20_g7356 [Dentipellis fragilis]
MDLSRRSLVTGLDRLDRGAVKKLEPAGELRIRLAKAMRLAAGKEACPSRRGHGLRAMGLNSRCARTTMFGSPDSFLQSASLEVTRCGWTPDLPTLLRIRVDALAQICGP